MITKCVHHYEKDSWLHKNGITKSVIKERQTLLSRQHDSSRAATSVNVNTMEDEETAVLQPTCHRHECVEVRSGHPVHARHPVERIQTFRAQRE
jgi:hypothetical protein